MAMRRTGLRKQTWYCKLCGARHKRFKKPEICVRCIRCTEFTKSKG